MVKAKIRKGRKIGINRNKIKQEVQKYINPDLDQDTANKIQNKLTTRKINKMIKNQVKDRLLLRDKIFRKEKKNRIKFDKNRTELSSNEIKKFLTYQNIKTDFVQQITDLEDHNKELLLKYNKSKSDVRKTIRIQYHNNILKIRLLKKNIKRLYKDKTNRGLKMDMGPSTCRAHLYEKAKNIVMCSVFKKRIKNMLNDKNNHRKDKITNLFQNMIKEAPKSSNQHKCFSSLLKSLDKGSCKHASGITYYRINQQLKNKKPRESACNLIKELKHVINKIKK